MLKIYKHRNGVRRAMLATQAIARRDLDRRIKIGIRR